MMKRWFCLAVCVLLLLPAVCLAEFDGFTLEELAFPGVRLEGRTLVVPEGVTELGTFWNEDEDDERLRLDGSFLVVRDGEGDWVPLYDNVCLPATLKRLKDESLVCMEIVGDLVIPEGVEEMGHYSLYGTHILGQLALPSTLRTEPFFADCTFDGITISPDNPLYCTEDGVVFTKDMAELVWYPSCRTAAHYDVPKGVRVIRSCAFEGNRYLQTVSLPVGLTAIRDGAFAECGRLTAVNVPLTVTELGACAFMDCVSLQRATLPPAFVTPAGMRDTEDETEWDEPGQSGSLPPMIFDNCPALGTFEGDNGRT